VINILEIKIPLALFLIVYSIYLIKTFKKKTLFKNFVVLSFTIYVISIINLTIFPIPIEKSTIYFAKESSYLQNNFIPFQFLNNFSIYQSLGNFLLLLPLSFYLLILNKKFNSYKKVFTVGLLFSLSIELTQFLISTLAGFTYRVTDIDDLILNTLGALFGYFIAKFLLNGFEKLFQINIYSLLKKPITKGVIK
jgi:glycopeptide antibiotics resistance protein